MSEAEFDADELLSKIDALGEKLAEARGSITRRFIGQERVVDLVLTTLLCGGHGLLIGLPGLGKTRLVDTLGTVMGLEDSRIQFTPDLMPADIVGTTVLLTSNSGESEQPRAPETSVSVAPWAHPRGDIGASAQVRF